MRLVSAINRAIKYHIIKGLLILLRFMPYRMAITLCKAMGVAIWAVDPFHRRIAEIQMRAALQNEYSTWMPLKVFINISESVIDIIRFSHMSDEKAHSKVKIHGQKHLDAALKTDRGIMFISAHIGNWEVVLQITRLTGIDLSILANRRKDAEIESLIQQVRSSGRLAILPPKGGMVTRLITELKARRHICFFIDKRGKRRSKFFCDYFGIPAPTSPAPAFVALKADALVLPVYVMKEGDTFGMYFGPAIEARSFGTDVDEIEKLRESAHSEAVQRLSDYMQAWVESVIRQHPEQWTWQYPRWIRRSDMRRLLRSGLDFRQYVEDQARKVSNVYGS